MTTTTTKRITAPNGKHAMIDAMLMPDLNDLPDDCEINREQFEDALATSNVISINYYKNSDDAEGPSEDESSDPQLLNDAKIIGASTPSFEKLMDRPITMFVGAHGKLTTWPVVTTSLRALITGGSAGGFSIHREARRKGGLCFVPAQFTGTKRSVAAVRFLHGVGLDFDSGTKRANVEEKIEELGIAAIVYTSYSDQKTVSDIKRTALFKDMPHIDGEPTTAHVQEYLRDHASAIYTEDHITSVEVTDTNHSTNDGAVVLYSHAPLDKFRVYLPFQDSVDVESIHRELQPRKDAWANKVVGAAYNLLGGHLDLACIDMSRVFYMPEHPQGASPSITIFRGNPMAYEDVPSMDKDVYRGMFKPKVAAQKADGLLMPSGTPWPVWAAQNADRLQIATLIETEFPNMARNRKGDLLEIECPNEDSHSVPGGTGTHVVDADGVGGGFRFGCKHSCPDDRLVLLAALAQNQYFDESWLWEDHDNGGYLWPEGEEDPEAQNARDKMKEDRRAEVLGGLIAEAKVLDNQSSDRAISDLLTQAYTNFEVIGETGKAALLEAIAGETNLGVRKLEPMWKRVAEEHAAGLVAEEARRRAEMKTPNYIPVSEATSVSVGNAAAASKWLPSGFVNRDGWFAQVRDDKAMRVSREFEVLYCADGKKGSTRTNEVTIRYQHRTISLGVVESTFRIGDTYKDSGTILGRLRNEGLDFAPGAPTEAVLTLLRAVNSVREAVYVEQSGWLSDKVYVSPTGEVVKHPADKRLYVLDHTMRVSNAKAGNLLMAVEAASAALRGRNAKRFLPGFLGGAVGCLADFLDEELAVIVANEGKAKHGKTTSLKAGISWFAVASAEGLLITGNTTPTAMEAKAVEASGAMFAPDEQGTSKATANDEQANALQFAGRIGRARGKTDGTLRDVNTWHGCMGMSTERGLLDRLEAEQAQDSSIDIRSGALSRIFTVSYDSAVKLDREEDAVELAAYDVLAHGGAYGWLGPMFAAKLMELGVDEVRGRVSTLVSEWGKGRSGAAERVVRTAALFGVAAQIGQEADLLPDDVNLKAMLSELLTETLDQRAHHLDTERQAKDSLRRTIIRMVNRRQIVEVGHADEARGEIVGYWISNSKSDDLAARTYILPVDRLGMLVKTETGALVDQMREESAVVLPSTGTKFFKRGLWENTPSEGKKVPSLRITGEWVHGDLDTDEVAA